MDKWYLIVIITTAGLLLVLLLWLIFGYNQLKKARVKVQEAESGIDVVLAKQFDVLIKMIEILKGYSNDESDSLNRIVNMQNAIQMNDTSIIEKQDVSRQMDDMIREINQIVDKYPDLKASENFKTFQLSISDVEEHLQASRRVYNANVSSFNQKVRVFPSNIIAKLFKFKSREFFETEDFKRQDVELKF